MPFVTLFADSVILAVFLWSVCYIMAGDAFIKIPTSPNLQRTQNRPLNIKLKKISQYKKRLQKPFHVKKIPQKKFIAVVFLESRAGWFVHPISAPNFLESSDTISSVCFFRLGSSSVDQLIIHINRCKVRYQTSHDISNKSKNNRSYILR